MVTGIGQLMATTDTGASERTRQRHDIIQAPILARPAARPDCRAAPHYRRTESGRFLLFRQQRIGHFRLHGLPLWSRLPARRLERLRRRLAAECDGLTTASIRPDVNGAGQVSAGCGTIAARRVLGTCLVTRGRGPRSGRPRRRWRRARDHNENPPRRPPRRIGSRYLHRALGRTNTCMLRLMSRHRGDPLIGNLDMRSAQTVSIPKLPHYPPRDRPFRRISHDDFPGPFSPPVPGGERGYICARHANWVKTAISTKLVQATGLFPALG